MCGSILVGIVKKTEMKLSILHHVNGDIGGIVMICQICNLKQFSIIAEDKTNYLINVIFQKTVYNIVGSASNNTLVISLSLNNNLQTYRNSLCDTTYNYYN